jgi:proline iminopeptidase
MSTSGSFSTNHGIQIYYEQRGSSGPALVVPSLSWLGADMDGLAPGRRVIFYDIRGRGRSSPILDEAHLGLEHDLRDLEGLREHLGLGRMSLLGWSYHGALCMRYAFAHPERVDRLLMVGPTAPRENPHWMNFLENFGMRCQMEWLREMEEARRSGLKESDPLAWAQLVNGIYFKCYVQDQSVLERMQSSPSVEPNLDAERVSDQGRRLLEKLGDYDWRAEFEGFELETLILHGEHDPVSIAGSREWQQCLSNCELRELDGVGHMPWLEAPERFFSAANAFLTRPATQSMQ